MQLEQIRATLTADASQFVGGFTRARGAMNDFTIRAGQSNRAIGIMRNSMVALATQATGAAGPVGRLAQGLLMLGGGGGLVLAVAAGIGALSLAYKALTQSTRDAQQAQEDMMKALAGIGVHGQLTAARVKLQQLQAALKKLQEPFGPFMGETRGTTGQLEEQQRKIATQLIEVARLEREVAKWAKQMADDAEREAAARGRTAALLRNIPDSALVAQLQGASLFQRDQARMRERLGLDIGDDERRAMQYRLDTQNWKFRNIFQGDGRSQFQEDVRAFGISAGRQFIMGMIEGIESMQDLLRVVLMSVLDFGIGMILNGIIPGGSIVGSPAQGVVDMPKSPNMPSMQPVTAYFVARDPAFQQLLREGILVAGSQGFRG